ncbi:MAG: glycosyltransferase family 39 protein [Candidatus Dojkabacteria bacterium]|nr:glycosyltransferase family 39 protein [Candidatus Dojkabacteria bacterium]
MNFNSKIIYPVLVIFFLLFTFSLPRINADREIFNSPLQNTNYVFSKHYAETGTLQIPVPYNDLPEDLRIAFTPRDSVQFGGFIEPHSFLFPLMVNGYVYNIVGEFSFEVVMSISSVICLIVLMAIFNQFTDKKNGSVLPIILLGFFPLFYLLSSLTIKPEIQHLMFFLLMTFYVLKLLNRWNSGQFYLALLMGIITILYRYESVFILMFFAIWLIIKRWKEIFISQHILKIILLYLIFVFPFLSLNNELYGSSFRIGYQVYQQIRASISSPQASSSQAFLGLFRFDMNVLFSHFLNYFVKSNFIYSGLISCGYLSLYFFNLGAKQNRLLKSLYLIIGGCFIFLLFIYGGNKINGYNSYIVIPSLLRYLLPLLALLFILASLFLQRIKDKTFLILIIVVLLIINTNTIVNKPGGLYEKSGYTRLHDLRSFVLDNTSVDSIVVVKRYDKILYPDRDVVVLTYLARKGDVIQVEDGFYGKIPSLELFVDKLTILLGYNENVYLFESDDYGYDNRALMNEFQRRGLRAIKIETGDYKLLKIENFR